jgi:hypothetical protein
MPEDGRVGRNMLKWILNSEDNTNLIAIDELFQYGLEFHSILINLWGSRGTDNVHCFLGVTPFSLVATYHFG